MKGGADTTPDNQGFTKKGHQENTTHRKTVNNTDPKQFKITSQLASIANRKKDKILSVLTNVPHIHTSQSLTLSYPGSGNRTYTWGWGALSASLWKSRLKPPETHGL